MEDSDIVIFRAIYNFLKDVSSACTKKYKPLALYTRLVEKTTIVNEEPIMKHVSVFREFCTGNRKGFETQKVGDLQNTKISYSERVYIDITHLFKIIEKVDHEAIWKHLLIISTLTDKEGNSKNILKEIKKKEKNAKLNLGKGNEANFINNMVEKVGENIDPNTSNPMEAVSSIMSSGIFTELIGDMNKGVESGDMNLGGLMGVVQNMMGSLDGKLNEKGQGGGQGGLGDMTKMMSTMMSSLNLDEQEGDEINNEDKSKEDNIREQIEKDIEIAYMVEEDVDEENVDEENTKQEENIDEIENTKQEDINKQVEKIEEIKDDTN